MRVLLFRNFPNGRVGGSPNHPCGKLVSISFLYQFELIWLFFGFQKNCENGQTKKFEYCLLGCLGSKELKNASPIDPNSLLGCLLFDLLNMKNMITIIYVLFFLIFFFCKHSYVKSNRAHATSSDSVPGCFSFFYLFFL